MKILLCDDHAVFREGVKGVLEPLGADFVDAASTDEALATLAEDSDFDVVLLDLAMPGPDGWAALRSIRSQHPTVPVVIVSGSEDPAQVREALDGGAAGFIPKASSPSVVRSALALVLEGSVYIPPLLLEKLEPTPRGEAQRTPRDLKRQRVGGLTTRQREVAFMMSKGLTNGEIADALSIAESTVKTHVSAILDELDVTNRTEAVLALRERGLEEEG